MWEGIKKEIEELLELLKLSKDDNVLEKEIAERLSELEEKYSKEEFRILLSGAYDKNDAYLTIYSGAGGRDAQDWAKMLLRMYQRYLERKGYEDVLHDEALGEEGGIKEATFEARGSYAYGFLKNEHGVHRLVRISPFSAQKLRHTSFALVEVIPKLDEVKDLVIPEEDLRIDTFRSSGPGGQNVNRRETAVRATHIPTGISASSQQERHQAQNKLHALKLLHSKLFMIKLREQKKELGGLKGGNIQAEWGNQIRSYIIHPYKMVKDHRTGVETSDVEAVLDGALDQFVDASIKSLKSKEAKI